MSKQVTFFDTHKNAAIDTQRRYGIPASITLAQAALESGWGLSGLTLKANNFFGIKADKSWNGEYYEAQTKEFVNGAYITIISKFRKYPNALQSFEDHAAFLKRFSRYKFLFNLPSNDFKAWAEGLQKAGYATDPLYPSKLMTLITKYNLSQYDVSGTLPDPKKLQP